MKKQLLSFLFLLLITTGAVAAPTADPSTISAALAAKDYALAASLLEEYLTGKPSREVHQWIGDLLYADFMSAPEQNEQTFLQVTARRASQYRKSTLDARISLASRLNRKVYYKLVFEHYSTAEKVSHSTARKICDMKFHREGDRHGALAYADKMKLNHSILVYLQHSTGDFSREEMLLLYQAITRIIGNPTAVITHTQAMEWSSKTLVNLFTSGVITEDQFVTALKALQKRVYLNLGKDRKRWEPVIASIRFGIEHADKIAALGE